MRNGYMYISVTISWFKVVKKPIPGTLGTRIHLNHLSLQLSYKLICIIQHSR